MLITHATALIGDAFIPGMSLGTAGGKIAAIGADPEDFAPYHKDQPVDLQGDYLLPGFVDVHVHAFMGRDTMDGEDAVRHISRELRKTGVAAFLPTTMSAGPEDTRKALAGIRSVMERPEPEGAAVLGAHMEAPFMEARRAGAQRKEFFVLPTEANWREYTGGHEGVVRMISLAPELPGALEFIRDLRSKGIVVSLGHTDCTAEQLHQAADYGASQTTHTFNAQSSLNHRAPGAPGGALVDDRIACQFICDGIHLHPDIIRLIARCKGPDLAMAITDAMEAAGMPEGAYQLGGQDVFVQDGAVRLKDGTLAGSTLTLARALQNLITFGIAPEHAARMVTSTPALSIREDAYGQLKAGAPGVMVRLGKDWSLKEVFA